MKRASRERSRALVRVLQLSDRLRTGRYTLRSLADEFGVNPRTIRRDLEVLSVAGIPVVRGAVLERDMAEVVWWIQR